MPGYKHPIGGGGRESLGADEPQKDGVPLPGMLADRLVVVMMSL